MEILAKEILLACAKPLQLMVQKVHALIVDEVKSSDYFRLFSWFNIRSIPYRSVKWCTFHASGSQWKIFKGSIRNECALKSFLWYQMGGTRHGSRILKFILKILESLECIAEDQSLKGDAGREASNIAYWMQQLEFVFMLNFWILHNFHRVNQVLQNNDVNLKKTICAALHWCLAVHITR